jgi:hypothetical protein
VVLFLDHLVFLHQQKCLGYRSGTGTGRDCRVQYSLGLANNKVHLESWAIESMRYETRKVNMAHRVTWLLRKNQGEFNHTS